MITTTLRHELPVTTAEQETFWNNIQAMLRSADSTMVSRALGIKGGAHFKAYWKEPITDAFKYHPYTGRTLVITDNDGVLDSRALAWTLQTYLRVFPTVVPFDLMWTTGVCGCALRVTRSRIRYSDTGIILRSWEHQDIHPEGSTEGHV